MAKTEEGNGLNLRGSAERLTDNVTGLEVNGSVTPEDAPVDRYGFTGGAQQISGDW